MKYLHFYLLAFVEPSFTTLDSCSTSDEDIHTFSFLRIMVILNNSHIFSWLLCLEQDVVLLLKQNHKENNIIVFCRKQNQNDLD